MKRLLRLGFHCVVLLCWVMPGQAQVHTKPQQHHAADHKFFNPDAIQWQEGPASLPKGAKVSLLEGDLAKAEVFTLRIMFPANYKVAPHWHPATEHVTVLQGDLYMGTGEKPDPGTAKKMEAGAFGVMPAKVVHYAFTKGETIIQVHGMGPWAITYVNSADDPRLANK
jgi:quercetin dioxygenase-like cupin family protein